MSLRRASARLLACGMLVVAAGTHAQVTPVVEFYNKALDHYFISLVLPAAGVP